MKVKDDVECKKRPVVRQHRCPVSLRVRAVWSLVSLGVAGLCAFSFLQPYWLTNTLSGDSFGMYHYCLQRKGHHAMLPHALRMAARTKNAAAQDRKFKEHQGHARGQPGTLRGNEPSGTRQQGFRNASRRGRSDVNRRPETSSPWLPAPPRGTEPPTLCGIYGNYFRLSHLPSNAWQVACVLYGGGCAMMGVGALAAIITSFLTGIWSHRLAIYTGYIQSMAVVTLAGGVLTFPTGFDAKFVQHYCPGARMYSTGDCHVGWSYMLGIMGVALSVFCPYLSQFTNFKERKKPYIEIYI